MARCGRSRVSAHPASGSFCVPQVKLTVPLLEAVMVNRDGPDKPLEEGELVAKFDDCVERGLPPHIVRSLRTAIDDLPSGSAARLAQLFRPI